MHGSRTRCRNDSFMMTFSVFLLLPGEFPFAPVYCLAWICLDVLFCTASIMHLCTISVDRYLSLRYPMKFGRNKTRRRVILKIVFVWLLSIAMSLPLSLMYSKVSCDYAPCLYRTLYPHRRVRPGGQFHSFYTTDLETFPYSIQNCMKQNIICIVYLLIDTILSSYSLSHFLFLSLFLSHSPSFPSTFLFSITIRNS